MSMVPFSYCYETGYGSTDPTDNYLNIPYYDEVLNEEPLGSTLIVESQPIIPVDSIKTKPLNVCSVCGQSFSRPASLANHEKIHTNYQPGRALNGITDTEIEQLLASTNVSDLIINDPLINSIEPPLYNVQKPILCTTSSGATNTNRFICERCGQGFSTKAKLTRHQIVHLNSTSSGGVNSSAVLLNCPQCEKVFNSRQGLSVHRRVHSNERPYGCRFCDKSFRDGGTLRKHERIHTMERPYMCPLCSVTFTQKGGLRDHLNAIHVTIQQQNVIFKCPLCSITMPDQSVFFTHLLDHSDQLSTHHQIDNIPQPIQSHQYQHYNNNNLQHYDDLGTTSNDDLFSFLESLNVIENID